MKQRRPDDVIRCSADADPMSKTIIGPMKLSVIGPMKHPSRARHRADEVVLVVLRLLVVGFTLLESAWRHFFLCRVVQPSLLSICQLPRPGVSVITRCVYDTSYTNTYLLCIP